MIHRTELITMHIFDLLEMLDTPLSSDGSVSLLVGGEEGAEVDFNDVCIVLRVHRGGPEPTGPIIIPLQTTEPGLP